MAHASSFDPGRVDATEKSGRRTDRLVVVGVDRTKQFGRARRHTLLVKAMRWLLPLATIGAIGAYGASAITSADFTADLGLRVISRILPENLTMNNPYYEGFTDDGGSYTVRANTAQQDLKKPDRIKLNGITGVMTDAKKSKTDLTAANGVFDSKRSVLVLGGGIDIVSQDGLSAKLSTATVQTKRGVITSNDPVQVNMQGGQVNSGALRIDQKEKVVTFIKDVRTKLIPNSDPGKVKDAAAPATKPDRRTAMMGGSDTPIDIDSARLTIDRGTGVAVFVGNVKAVQGDQTLLTPVLNVTFQEPADAGKPAENADAGKTGAASVLPDASRIKLITAPRPIILTRGELDQVTGNSAVFDAKNETALITGNVVIASGPDRRAVAETAEIDSKNDVILLIGGVIVKQGDNELRGERLYVDRTKGISRMSTPPGANGKPGRIFASMRRQPDAATATAATPTPAADEAGKPEKPAAASAFAMTAFKGDPKAPIDIEANQLDVDDQRKQAVFSGQVVAVQGVMSLTTKQLTAIYAGNASLIGTDPAAQGDPGAGTELTRILAKGDVFVASKVSGQNAKGDWADIDMKANTVLLGGDVVLSQGKNVVKATSMKIDLLTGNTIVETSPEERSGSGWASTTIPNVVQGGKALPLKVIRGNRPSAVFYPTQLQDGSKPKPGLAAPSTASGTQPTAAPSVAPARAASGPPRPAAASSWDATTEPSGTTGR